MRIPRSARLTGAAVVALAAAGAVVAITASAAGVPLSPFAASSPSPSASPKPGSAARDAECQAFVSNFASALGKSSDQVQAAAQSAFAKTVDDAVKAGKLTQAQADAMKARFASGGVCAGPLAGGLDHGGPGRPGGKLMGKYESYVASVLGISTTELAADLKGGQTVKDLAAAKGMDESAFRTRLVAAAKSDLDAQVAAGKLTQAQEDAALKMLQAAPIPGWNGMPAGHPHAAPSPRPTT